MTTNARKIKGDVRSAEMEEESMLFRDEARPKGTAWIWYDPSSPFFPLSFMKLILFVVSMQSQQFQGDASWCQGQRTASILISSSISKLEF